MKVIETILPEVLLVEPRIFRDARGQFMESWHEQRYREAGIPGPFVQDNISVSTRGVLRGMHFQEPHAQGKLISVLRGEIWDVAVDIRVGSESFGKWTAEVLSSENGRQLYIPEGFAHGFVTRSSEAVVVYKCTAPYHPAAEGTIRWDDPDLAIAWPIESPLLSDKDAGAPYLREVDPEHLPRLLVQA